MKIDLRSDAVTRPTDVMWDAMRSADIGWAPSGDDPHVRELESTVAGFLGKEAGVLVPGGGAANLLAILGQAERGEQIVVDDLSHILWAEEWGFAYVGGCVIRTVPGNRGRIKANALQAAICEQSFRHRPRTALVCIENSHNASGGSALSAEYMHEIAAVVRANGARLHVDGARLLNSAAALGVEARILVETADSVSFNLNKGLSAPWGAVLCGSRTLIDRSRVTMRRLGHSLPHQAGLFAVAGLVAMRTMIDQHAIDNRRAADLARALGAIGGDRLSIWPVDTNIVFASTRSDWLTAAEFQSHLEACGVLVSVVSDRVIRLVTHRHVGDTDVAEAVASVKRAIDMR